MQCGSGGILFHIPLYTPDNSIRQTWLCSICSGRWGLTTPWPGTITAEHFDLEVQKPKRRGPPVTVGQLATFPALFTAVRTTFYEREKRPPTDDELGALLAPHMGWERGDERTLRRWKTKYGIE